MIVSKVAYLLDTSILARLILPSDPLHHDTDAAVAALIARGDELYVTPQNLIELRSVTTRPPGMPSNGMGLTSVESDVQITRMKALFGFLPDTAAIFPRWRQLTVDHSVLGRNVHDARLAAVMLVYGITHILTLNGQHFKRFPGLTVIAPTDVTSLAAKLIGKWEGHSINELGQPSELDTISLDVFEDLTFSGSHNRLLHGSMNAFMLSGQISPEGAVTFRHGYRDEESGSPTSLLDGFGELSVNESDELVGRLNVGTPQLIITSLAFRCTRSL